MAGLPRPRGLCVDAAGTLLDPAVPAWQTYAELANAHGARTSPSEVRSRLRPAMAQHRALRGLDPGWRAYWRAVVASSTGSEDPALFDALYRHYAKPSNWRVAVGAPQSLGALRAKGIPLALVSNWDERLPALLRRLDLFELFDVVLVSAQVGLEKPDPAIFRMACERLGLLPAHVVHVGDDPEDDGAGARQAGCQAWAFGEDGLDFPTVAARFGVEPAPATTPL